MAFWTYILRCADGSFYVADSRNNRIEHFSQDGKVLKGPNYKKPDLSDLFNDP